MESILAHAQELVYTLLSLMPSQYQRDNLEAMLGLFLEAQGSPLPQRSQTKSASALSRFLNIYAWSTRKIIRTTREQVLKEILSQCPKGRKPFLQVIIDLTTLEKCGKFKSFENLITVYNGKRGLHLVVVYLVFGQWRVPWSFRVFRGKGTTSPARLGLKLVKSLPSALTKHFKVIILAAQPEVLSFFMGYVSLNIMPSLVCALTANWLMGVFYDVYINVDSKYGLWV